MKIGFLISKTVVNKKPKHELDYIRLERKIVYSWQEMPAWAKKRYDREMVLLFQALSYNKTLSRAVENFRERFGLPAQGISFKENEKAICHIGKGPLYRFDALPVRATGTYEEEQQFIENFQKENIVADPFKIHLQTIFYAGFVDVSANSIPPISCSIPDIPKTTTGTIFQYRPPVAILINSRNLSRSEVKKQIDKNWPAIQQYFRQHPFITDASRLEWSIQILSLKQEGKTARQILQDLDTMAIQEGNLVNYNNSDASIRKSLERAKKEVNKLICPRKKKCD